MAATGHDALNRTVEKTTQLRREVEVAYGWPPERRGQSFAALRAVLHAIRDRLTVHEAADFAGPLPMLVRGLYYEGWQPAKVPMKSSKHDFLERIQETFNYAAEGGTELLVERVVLALSHHIPEGEWDDVRVMLPKDLADVLPT